MLIIKDKKKKCFIKKGKKTTKSWIKRQLKHYRYVSVKIDHLCLHNVYLRMLLFSSRIWQWDFATIFHVSFRKASRLSICYIEYRIIISTYIKCLPSVQKNVNVNNTVKSPWHYIATGNNPTDMLAVQSYILCTAPCFPPTLPCAQSPVNYGNKKLLFLSWSVTSSPPQTAESGCQGCSPPPHSNIWRLRLIIHHRVC